MINEYVKAAAESRAHELEAAIQRFRECGVEMERFSIEEWPNETRLCVDGTARFTWRMVCDLPGWRSPRPECEYCHERHDQRVACPAYVASRAAVSRS